MGTITTKDGTEIPCKDWGKGRPVVLSHGWPLDSAMLFAKLVKSSTLKVYPGASHGMAEIMRDQINADLLAFIKA